jgi:hypothetical protein
MDTQRSDTEWIAIIERAEEDRAVLDAALRWLRGEPRRYGDRDPALPWDSPKFGRGRLSPSSSW